jgi:hypothetical protein
MQTRFRERETKGFDRSGRAVYPDHDPAHDDLLDWAPDLAGRTVSIADTAGGSIGARTESAAAKYRPAGGTALRLASARLSATRQQDAGRAGSDELLARPDDQHTHG